MKLAALRLWEWAVYGAWHAAIAVEERLCRAHYRAESRLRREEGKR